MSSQIFKQLFSKNILFDFLNQFCSSSNPYIINKETFKKINLNPEILHDFVSKLEPFYYSSKKHYITKKMTLNSLCTILRQICNFLKIQYTSEIKYFKSKYEIVYYIFKEEEL